MLSRVQNSQKIYLVLFLLSLLCRFESQVFDSAYTDHILSKDCDFDKINGTNSICEHGLEKNLGNNFTFSCIPLRKLSGFTFLKSLFAGKHHVW